MDLIAIFFTSISLAMDAFAVALANGALIKCSPVRPALKFGLFFGGFQFIMPVAGYFGGLTFSAHIEKYSHWIAFGLLAIIGGKMIWESMTNDCCELPQPDGELTAVNRLVLLAVATSIDAMAVGVSLAMLGGTNIWVASAIIGCVAFVLSVAGVMIGKKVGCLFQKSAALLGGVVLICIGLKILLENFLP